MDQVIVTLARIYRFEYVVWLMIVLCSRKTIWEQILKAENCLVYLVFNFDWLVDT